MPKPTDILNRAGGGGLPNNSGKNNPFKITPPSKDGEDKDAKKTSGESIAAKKPDMGHNLSGKAGKAHGGAGSAGRPKV